MPAVQMYDLARAHIARGLNSGGVRILWNQFSTGSFVPMPYKAFETVFDQGWVKYDPFAEDCGPLYKLHRPDGKPIKRLSLSYKYAEENQVSFLHYPRIKSSLFQVSFKEIRYLHGMSALQSWLDFGSLVPANPAQYGCAKVASWNKSEVKFVTGVWVMFKYLPTHPQPCKRVTITGWMSVAHWNGHLFRIGETGDGIPDTDDIDERELANVAHDLTVQELD